MELRYGALVPYHPSPPLAPSTIPPRTCFTHLSKVHGPFIGAHLTLYSLLKVGFILLAHMLANE
jgi:hypothetical protein